MHEQAFSPAECYVSGYLSVADNANQALSRLEIPVDCFAIRLFNRLHTVGQEHGQVRDFYEKCASGFMSEIHDGDVELLQIYLKQMAMISRAAGLDPVQEGLKHSSKDLLWNVLFGAFWNVVDWSDLFPSMPEEAGVLWQNRAVVLELLHSQDAIISIDQLVDDYMLVTGHRAESSMLLASFLDFSVLTWLSHFGILSFTGSENNPVTAGLTNFGRCYLLSLDE